MSTLDRVFIVNIDKMSELGYSKFNLKTMTFEQLKELATNIYTPKEAIELIDLEQLNLEDNVLIYKEGL